MSSKRQKTDTKEATVQWTSLVAQLWQYALAFLDVGDHLEASKTCKFLKLQASLPESWCPTLQLETANHVNGVYRAGLRYPQKLVLGEREAWQAFTHIIELRLGWASRLRILDFSDEDTTIDYITWISQLPNIEELSLPRSIGNVLSPPPTLRALRGYYTLPPKLIGQHTLERLEEVECKRLQDDPWFMRCPNLTKLTLSHGYHKDAHETWACNKLRSLDLSGFRVGSLANFDDLYLSLLSVCNSSLTELHLPHLDDYPKSRVWQAVLADAPNLRILSIFDAISQGSFYDIRPLCQSLFSKKKNFSRLQIFNDGDWAGCSGDIVDFSSVGPPWSVLEFDSLDAMESYNWSVCDPTRRILAWYHLDECDCGCEGDE